MTTFQILWVIAGCILGWIGLDFLGAMVKVRVPWLFNLAFAFVGGLIAYTLLK